MANSSSDSGAPMVFMSSLYSQFAREKPCWPLIASSGALSAVALSGMAMNLAVIYVTVRTKSLHGTANYLLALNSLFSLVHQYGHLLSLFVALSARSLIPYRWAVRICTGSLFGLGGTSPSLLFTGLDRFICVSFPILHRSLDKRHYLTGVTVLCACFCCFSAALFNSVSSDTLITGSISDILSVAFSQGVTGPIYGYVMLATNTSTVLIYVATGVKMHLRAGKSKSPANGTEQSGNARVFRSLLVIISFSVGGYLANGLFNTFAVPQLSAFPLALWLGKQAVAVLLNLSVSSNAPVLYLMSEEYRRAFRKRIPLMRPQAGDWSNGTTKICVPAPTKSIPPQQPNTKFGV